MEVRNILKDMAGIVASKMRRQRSKNSGQQGGPQVRDHHEEWEKRRKQVRNPLVKKGLVNYFSQIHSQWVEARCFGWLGGFQVIQYVNWIGPGCMVVDLGGVK